VLAYVRQGDVMRRLSIFAFFCAFFVSALAFGKEVTIHGFVTDIKSSTRFELKKDSDQFHHVAEVVKRFEADSKKKKED
jgi:hypothetical protein